jgi:hypothetical protein
MHQCGVEPWSIQQACAALRQGGFVVLPIVLADEQIQEFFPPRNMHSAVRLSKEGVG